MHGRAGTDSQWDMPLQLSHLALGFRTALSRRIILSFVFENTAAAGGFVSGWKELPRDQVHFLCCRHTKHCSETPGCSCHSWSLPVTTCLRALFGQDHSLLSSCCARLCLCPCFMTSLEPFYLSFLKLLIYLAYRAGAWAFRFCPFLTHLPG